MLKIFNSTNKKKKKSVLFLHVLTPWGEHNHFFFHNTSFTSIFYHL